MASPGFTYLRLLVEVPEPSLSVAKTFNWPVCTMNIFSSGSPT